MVFGRASNINILLEKCCSVASTAGDTSVIPTREKNALKVSHLKIKAEAKSVSFFSKS